MARVRRRQATLAAPPVSEEDLRQLSARNNEPAWLLNHRLESWEIYESLPMPTLQDEEWRRTDYRHIRWEEAGPLATQNGARPAIDVIPKENLAPLIGEEQGGLLVFVDGELIRYEFGDALAQQGIYFAELQQASQERSELVQRYFMQKAVLPTDGKFAALHGALWTHGVFLYVPPHVVAELPLHVVNYVTKPGATFGHVLVIVEENAQATLLVDYASPPGEKQAAYIGATELIVGDAANLRYVALQDWNRQTFEFSHQRARVGREGQLDWIVGTMGTQLTKAHLELELDGRGANGRMSGFFFADDDQHFDLDTQQNHNAPLTSTDLLFKGAAKDVARTVWQGMIKSLPNMQKIDGYQVCRNLLLSKDARMDSIPGLEIEADDVACSHAATFGTLEEELMFYLMSRGITRPQAQLMLIDGFFDELLQRVPFARVRDRLQEAIEAKILS
ncbi:MAG: Fe-S cluster assembly protein SufD [Anaerolineaceae bacterium]|nr:Fe-S cluster assembly protein SufD [Anaerolineaceae bacterium]